MAAPVPSVRVQPTGYMLREGYRTLITFASNPAVQLWEETVKPPDMDGGEVIDITTMFNNRVETHWYRHIIKTGAATALCGYDPDVIPGLLAMVNVMDTVTLTFPDGSTWAGFGAMTKVEFPEHKRGEFPKATVSFDFGNFDTTTSLEQQPTYTPAAGT